MRSSIGFGLVFLSIVLAISFGVAFAESSKDKVNNTTSFNLTNVAKNTTKVTVAPLNATNVTKPKNTTKLQNPTKLEKSKANVNASAKISSTKPSDKTPFKIDDGFKEIEHPKESKQSSINGAYLVRAVDGTPHGAVSYR